MRYIWFKLYKKQKYKINTKIQKQNIFIQNSYEWVVHAKNQYRRQTPIHESKINNENRTFSFISLQYSSKLFSTVIILIISLALLFRECLIQKNNTLVELTWHKSANSAKPIPNFSLQNKFKVKWLLVRKENQRF